MLKYLFTFLILIFSLEAYSNENLLTIQQQLERLQSEVSDLSKIVYSNSDSPQANNDNITNLSAIDMRIYDLEKDVKSLTGNIEEILFKFDDLLIEINNFKQITLTLENQLKNIKSKNIEIDQKNVEKYSDIENNNNDKNTLGSIKITTEDKTENKIENNNNNENLTNSENTKNEISPEDQFQSAFDNIRNKKWEEAKISLQNFINNNPENQLSGSAHYWLGELYILEKKYRDAALVLAEGFQKFPESIKAADMLFKLSQSLYEVDKKSEACKTLEKLIIDYPKSNLMKKSKKQIQEYGCLESIE